MAERLYRADVEALADVRTRLGWSQRKLAKAVGVHASLIAQLETGRCGVSEKVLADIAKALGVPIDLIAVAEEATA